MNLRCVVRFALLATLASVLTGCGGMKVVGRVLPGAISYVGIVDHSDERLGQLGVGGVAVRIEGSDNSASTPIATATTAADGSFKLTIPTGSWPTDRVQVRALADGYAAARGSVYLPRQGQSMLILMERTAGD